MAAAGSERPGGSLGPARPSAALGWRGGPCLFCTAPAVWQHDLDPARSRFRTMSGKEKVWGGSQVLCDRCEQLYDSGDYAALARLQGDGEQDLLPDRLVALAAFCRADLGLRALAEPSFPAGFEPLDAFTGAQWVIEVWPQAHRLSVAESRAAQLLADPGARIWLVRSPWGSLTLSEVFRVLWTWAERDRETDQAVIRARVTEAFGWSEVAAARWLRRGEDRAEG